MPYWSCSSRSYGSIVVVVGPWSCALKSIAFKTTLPTQSNRLPLRTCAWTYRYIIFKKGCVLSVCSYIYLLFHISFPVGHPSQNVTTNHLHVSPKFHLLPELCKNSLTATQAFHPSMNSMPLISCWWLHFISTGMVYLCIPVAHGHTGHSGARLECTYSTRRLPCKFAPPEDSTEYV